MVRRRTSRSPACSLGVGSMMNSNANTSVSGTRARLWLSFTANLDLRAAAAAFERPCPCLPPLLCFHNLGDANHSAPSLLQYAQADVHVLACRSVSSRSPVTMGHFMPHPHRQKMSSVSCATLLGPWYFCVRNRNQAATPSGSMMPQPTSSASFSGALFLSCAPG